jgi:hypothetical protein
MCDGYFKNSLWPISYFGYTYVLWVRPEKKIVGKTTKSIFP